MNWMSHKQICKHSFYVHTYTIYISIFGTEKYLFSVPKIDMYIVYVCKYIDLYEYNLSMALERERERDRDLFLCHRGGKAPAIFPRVPIYA